MKHCWIYQTINLHNNRSKPLLSRFNQNPRAILSFFSKAILSHDFTSLTWIIISENIRLAAKRAVCVPAPSHLLTDRAEHRINTSQLQNKVRYIYLLNRAKYLCTKNIRAETSWKTHPFSLEHKLTPWIHCGLSLRFFKVGNDNCRYVECNLGVIFFPQQQKNIKSPHSRARIQSEGWLQEESDTLGEIPESLIFQNTDPHNFLRNMGHEKKWKTSRARWEHKC